MSDDGEEDGSYVALRGRQAKGVLYRITPMEDELQRRVHMYVHGGIMDKDMRYARVVYGLVNTSGRKDFELFWESPWNEEHVADTAKKRKLESQQRAMAVRSYIRASAPQDPTNVDKYIETVDQLTQWEDRHDAKELVKTVSRMVQSFERIAIRAITSLVTQTLYNRYRRAVEDALPRVGTSYDHHGEADEDNHGAFSVASSAIDTVACSMRRNDQFFDLLATSVAAEIIWADATNGTRSMPRHIYDRLAEKRTEATLNLVRSIYSFNPDFGSDTVGMPLMQAKGTLCVSRGVLVVCPGMQSATYILDIEGPHGGESMDLSNVRTITVTQVVAEDDKLNV